MSDFRSRCILRRTNEPVRPADRDSDIGTWVAGARLLSPDLAFPTANAVALRRRTQPTTASRRSNVTYADRTLTCVDCGVEFIHSAADQEYYAQKGFASDPKRCTSCRASRRAARDGGYDVREIGARCTARTASGRCGPTEGVPGRGRGAPGARSAHLGAVRPYPAHPANPAHPGPTAIPTRPARRPIPALPGHPAQRVRPYPANRPSRRVRPYGPSRTSPAHPAHPDPRPRLEHHEVPIRG